MQTKTPRILSHVRLTNSQLVQDGNCICNNVNNDVKQWLSIIYKEIKMDYPKFFKMDRLCKAGILASEMLMRRLPAVAENEKRRGAVICFNSAGSLDDDRAYQETIRDAENYFPSPSIFVYTLSNIVTGEIAIRHRILGESSCYIAPQFDPKDTADAISNALTDSDNEFVLAGWIDFDAENCDVLLFLVVNSDDMSLLPVEEMPQYSWK